MKKPRIPKWKMPKWMEPYRSSIINTGGNPIEELMNDTTSNMQNNHVRTALIIAVKSQLVFLEYLREKNELDRAPVNVVKTNNFDIGFMTAIAEVFAQGCDAEYLLSAMTSWGFSTHKIRATSLDSHDRTRIKSLITEMKKREGDRL